MMGTNFLILNIQLIKNNIIYQKCFEITKVGYFDRLLLKSETIKPLYLWWHSLHIGLLHTKFKLVSNDSLRFLQNFVLLMLDVRFSLLHILFHKSWKLNFENLSILLNFGFLTSKNFLKFLDLNMVFNFD